MRKSTTVLWARLAQLVRPGAVVTRATNPVAIQLAVHPERLEERIALCGTTAPLNPVLLETFAHPDAGETVVQQPLLHDAPTRRAPPRRAGRRQRVAAAAPVMTATNLTTPTLCAEEDNVNVPLTLPSATARFSFTIEARHPTYEIGHDSRDADFTHCPPPPISTGGGAQQTFTIYDDHVSTAVVAVRDPNFHQPGMRVRVGAAAVADIHFIRIIRRIAGTDSWPEVFVLYSDGNLRLKPQAPLVGGDPAFGGDPVFGSSVIVGAAPASERPVANIRTITYVPSKQSLHVGYAAGGKAALRVVQADRAATRVRVVAQYHASQQTPFATLRSMFVEDGNADVDRVTWADAAGVGHADAIQGFKSGQAGEFVFGRAIHSRHNTSAPDIRVSGLSYTLR